MVIVSRKLLPLLRQDIAVKLAGETYHVTSRISTLDSTDRDITLSMEVSEFNYFCYNKQNRITCWPITKGKQPLNESGQWRKEGRQELKPGRFFLLFSDYMYVSDNEGVTVRGEQRTKILARAAELFTASIQGQNAEMTYEISDTPSEIYQLPVHYQSGYLTSSCMRPGSGHGCRHFSGFYDTIPDVKILYKTLAEGVLFRALLWTTKSRQGKEITFLDRIYGTDVHIAKMIEIAQENDWAWRQFGNSSIVYKGSSDIQLYTAPLSEEAIDYLEHTGSPYMDTLAYLHRKEPGSNIAYLTNYYDEDDDCFIGEIQQCYGSTIHIMARCPDCGCRLIEGKTKNLEGQTYCLHCYDRLAVKCKGCHRVMHQANVMIVHTLDGKTQRHCMRCAGRLNLSRCQRCNNIHFTEDCVYHEPSGTWYCPICADDWPVCSYCNERHPRQYFATREKVDGKTLSRPICKECLHKYTTPCTLCGNRISGVFEGFKASCKKCQAEALSYYSRHDHLRPHCPPPMVDVEPTPIGYDMREQLRLWDLLEINPSPEPVTEMVEPDWRRMFNVHYTSSDWYAIASPEPEGPSVRRRMR